MENGAKLTDEQQNKAAQAIVKAIGEAIRDLGSVPDGVLYARVCGMMSLKTYQDIIFLLTYAGLIRKQNNVLTWIG